KGSPLPIIADIHYDYPLALLAMDAGVDGLRLNPGNIRDPDKVKEITRRAKERDIPIRIGVNAGSLPGRGKEGEGRRPPTEEVVDAMVRAALGHIAILEALDFNQIKVSMKASDPPTMIAANRAIADKIYYPLHLAVTESGPPRTGTVKGPGEGQHADIGIAGGKGKGILFKHGKIVGTFPEKELVPALLRELDAIAREDEQKLAS